MHKTTITYKKSGVDTNNTNKLVHFISKLSKKTKIKGSNVKGFRNIGGFGSLYDLSKEKIKNPILVTSTDGVGTKLEIANKLKKFDTIGIDLVAMCVNDLIVQGAKPIVFLDYIAIGKVTNKKYKNILKGIAKGCKESSCYLAGGETAEMPGIYENDKFDLAGFAVGIVDRKKILDGSKVKDGDALIAIPSSGVHSNGFSLVRYILKKKKLINNKKILRQLITPTKIYVNEILNLHKKKLINAACHITGGGLIENLPRILPEKLSIKLNLDKIKPHRIFSFIHNSNVNQNEMLKTFNCGVGFCVIAPKRNIQKIILSFGKTNKPYVIGSVIRKSGKKIILSGKIKF